MSKQVAASKKIAVRHQEIGARMREARERLGFSQKDFAEAVGIKRVRLASYETGRVPLRWEIALRICRRFQISEAWLATGGVNSKGYPKTPYPFGSASRCAMFKPSDSILETIRPGMLFSEAYDSVLRLEYWKLLGEAARTWTRFDFSESSSPEIVRIELDAAISKWAAMIPEQSAVRFFNTMIKCGMILFEGLYEGPFPSANRPPVLMIERGIDAAFKETKFT